MTVPASLTPKQFLERYENDPVAFAREVLHFEPDAWQKEVLETYGSGVRGISIRSAHGPGKTAVVAVAACHAQTCRFPQTTRVTAPTQKQLFDNFWAELVRCMKRLPPDILALHEITNSRIWFKPAPEESFISASTSRAEKPEALQGAHCEDGWVLIIADEASGIPDQVYEAAGGSMSGHRATTILISNPVRTSGMFFETHHRLRPHWKTFHVCADVPEAPPDSYKSARITAQYVAEQELWHGRRSNAFRIRVLGEFPSADDDSVIGYQHIAMAKQRDVSTNPHAAEVWGLDVARFGRNVNALVKRKANLLRFPVLVWEGQDLMATAGRVKAAWDQTPPHKRPVDICIDSIGLGAGVYDRLRELGLPVRAINVAESAAMEDRFSNLRAELWWKTREWFERKDCRIEPPTTDATAVEIERQATIARQLGQPRYKFTSSGKILVEAKDDMRKRGIESPDLADAFVLTQASDALTAAWGSIHGSGESVQRDGHRLA